MYRYLILLLAVTVLWSCKPSMVYDLSLSSVNRPADVAKPYGDKTIVSFADHAKPVYTYEDEYIHITWLFTQTQFVFEITNVSDNSISLNWDKMKYVDYKGNVINIVHTGEGDAPNAVSFDLNGNVVFTFVSNGKNDIFQVPTTVPAKASYKDYLEPIVKGHYEGEPDNWKRGSFFPQKTIHAANLDNFKKASESIRVRLHFPITINGTDNDYVFEFRINDIKQLKKKHNLCMQ